MNIVIHHLKMNIFPLMNILLFQIKVIILKIRQNIVTRHIKMNTPQLIIKVSILRLIIKSNTHKLPIIEMIILYMIIKSDIHLIRIHLILNNLFLIRPSNNNYKKHPKFALITPIIRPSILILILNLSHLDSIQPTYLILTIPLKGIITHTMISRSTLKYNGINTPTQLRFSQIH